MIQVLDKLASHPSILDARMNIATTPASTAHTSKTIDIGTMTWREKALDPSLSPDGFTQIDANRPFRRMTKLCQRSNEKLKKARPTEKGRANVRSHQA
jgi:hypothetical protein